jgi:hypothetical protein
MTLVNVADAMTSEAAAPAQLTTEEEEEEVMRE